MEKRLRPIARYSVIISRGTATARPSKGIPSKVSIVDNIAIPPPGIGGAAMAISTEPIIAVTIQVGVMAIL